MSNDPTSELRTAQHSFPEIVPPVKTSASEISLGMTPQRSSNVLYETPEGPDSAQSVAPIEAL
jgi:hypothetical protein